MSDTSDNTTNASNDSTNASNDSNNVKDLKKIIFDMTNDLLNTFPELDENLNESLRAIINETDNDDVEIKKNFEHCKSVFPERFFDILYQNKDIFNSEDSSNEDSENSENTSTNTEFLPGIDFKQLWKENISDKTRETIWKYLQLILFATVSNISDGDSFGDTAKLFEAINEDEFRAKLQDTISQMQSVFEAGDFQNNERG